jgi:hypothetical protein
MGMKRYLVVFNVLLLTSCILKGKHSSSELLSSYSKEQDIAYYFPAIKKQTPRDSTCLIINSRFLSLFDEQPIAEYTLNNAAIRFTYRRSFSDYLLIRIDNKEITIKQADQQQRGFDFRIDTTLLTAEELYKERLYGTYREMKIQRSPDTTKWLSTYPWIRNKEYGLMLTFKMYAPDTSSITYTTTTTAVGPDIIRGLIEHVNKASFWQMPIGAQPGGGLDGADWDLEVFANGKHHFVHDWSPESGAFYDLCRHILRYTQLKEDEIY